MELKDNYGESSAALMTSDRGNTGGAELTTPVHAEYLVSWENGAVLQYEVCNKKVHLKSGLIQNVVFSESSPYKKGITVLTLDHKSNITDMLEFLYPGLSIFFKCASTSLFTGGTFFLNLNNFHEYLVQHTSKSRGTKNRFKWVKVPGTTLY